MDRLAADLEQYLREPGSAHSADIHCRHVALRLVRRIRHGSRGELELKTLLQDLLDSMPPGPHAVLDRIRKQANLFLQIDLPMRPSALKRPSSAQLEPPAKRSKRTLEDVQLLYNYFHPLTPSNLPSVSAMLADASASSSATLVTTGSMHEIWQAAKPLLAPHKAIAAKMAHLEATFEAVDSPLAAATHGLGDLVDLLGKLCAPVRDPSVKKASDRVSTCKELLSLHGESEQAKDAVETAKASVYKLAQEMQQDMKAFKAGYTAASKGEGELREELRSEAMRREREAVTDLYGEVTISALATWCGILEGSLGRSQIATRLIQLLFQHQAITVPTVSRSGEMRSSDLSPVFLLAAKHLFRMQNRLQAVTVLATLSILVPINPSDAGWAQRIWTLLQSEMDTAESDSDHVKVANIAEEILLAIDSKADLEKANRNKIRRQVESLLSLEDPVFKLLGKRLEATISAGVTSEGLKSTPQGFAMEPLPGEIEHLITSLKRILDWSYTCWKIPP